VQCIAWRCIENHYTRKSHCNMSINNLNYIIDSPFSSSANSMSSRFTVGGFVGELAFSSTFVGMASVTLVSPSAGCDISSAWPLVSSGWPCFSPGVSSAFSPGSGWTSAVTTCSWLSSTSEFSEVVFSGGLDSVLSSFLGSLPPGSASPRDSN